MLQGSPSEEALSRNLFLIATFDCYCNAYGHSAQAGCCDDVSAVQAHLGAVLQYNVCHTM